MSKSMVRRQRRLLATPELKRRRRLTLREHLAVYAPIWMCVIGVLLFCVGVAGVVLFEGVGPDLAFTVPMMTGTGLVVAGFTWCCRMWWVEPSKVVSLHKRRFQVIADRNRRYRAHSDDEAGRLEDVLYTRYSVWVEPGKGEVHLVALAHDRRWPGLLLRWQATRTKKMWNARNALWSEEEARLATVQLGQDDALEVLGAAQLTVEQLEAEAYAHALKEYQVECMATALQPPPLSAGTRGALDSAHDDMERLLEQLHTNGETR